MNYLTEQQLKEAAKEFGMPLEEVRLMYERAIAGDTMVLKESLKENKGVAKSNGTSGVMPDATDEEEIPDEVKQAAKLLKMDAAKLMALVKTKAVGIQGGVPNGSETRAKRKLRMVTPLREAVKGKLLALTQPERKNVATIVKQWPTEQQVEALKLLKEPEFLSEFSGVSLKEAGHIVQTLRPFTSTHLNTNTVTSTRTKQVAEARQQVANTRKAALYDMYTSAVNLPDDDEIQARMKAIEDGQPFGNDVYHAFTSTHLNKQRVLTRRKEVIAPTMSEHQAVNASLQLKQDMGVARFHAQQAAWQHLRGTKLGR